MAIPLLLPVLGLAGDLLKRLIPDPGQRAKAEQELAVLQQNGELQAMATSMSAILAEAQSNDKWTSRARPSFLYVVYIIILSALPMGVLHAFNPEMAAGIAEGFKLWLAAIPEPMWTLFGVGYLGYAGARSWDKRSAGRGD